ncbi:helix-turn-helix domain-containing protein [Lactobacillus sp. M0398]|uniref:helix-turn-helix domain-containing protein n=1 Tax=unclassified Lactobacillus TaxID=2620435 RepID=UPI0018DBAA77|nr:MULTISPECIES: helix-turn-helix domain-containing protein [unclassified Lactobacillus]MBI0121321.1 helix-turn-helix domain-containing protein [Lactobacillus sp. M0398]MBI0123468.1 helix-turn-helix domain-containing protein [Lactobacillus sp. W8174]MBI0135467.1 helix-turn-helix domain-containing protein [Lactobacillus sp. W8173]
METAISRLLKSRNINIVDVAKKSAVSASTLRKAAVRPLETWSVRVLNAFATGLNERAGDLLNMLQPKEYKLDINDEKQTIQGVYVSDKAMYLELRGVIEASHLEGWNPTKKDIESVLDGVLNPDPEEVKEIMEIWEGSDE